MKLTALYDLAVKWRDEGEKMTAPFSNCSEERARGRQLTQAASELEKTLADICYKYPDLIQP